MRCLIGPSWKEIPEIGPHLILRTWKMCLLKKGKGKKENTVFVKKQVFNRQKHVLIGCLKIESQNQENSKIRHNN